MAHKFPYQFRAAGGQPAPISSASPQQSDGVQQHQQAASGQPAQIASQAQQSAFQQNAQLPQMDMSVLAGISPEQLFAIAQMFQTGSLTVPTLPAGVPPHANGVVAPMLPLPSALPQPDIPKENAQMDKSDGEVEDGDSVADHKQRAFLRPPPTGPRRRSQSPRDPQSRRASTFDRRPSPPLTMSRNASEQLAGDRAGTQAMRIIPPSATDNLRTRVGKESQAKAFLLQMHKAGYSYAELAPEIENSDLLHRMWQKLGLPLTTGSQIVKKSGISGAVSTATQQSQTIGATLSPHTNGTAGTHESPHVPATRKPSAGARPPAGKAKAPADRSEYLARLAATRKKPNGEVPLKVPEPKGVNQIGGRQVTALTSEAVSATTSSPAVRSPPKATDKNQLLLDKLAALKAQQAARKNAAPQNASTALLPAVSSVPVAAKPPQSEANLGTLPAWHTAPAKPSQAQQVVDLSDPPTPDSGAATPGASAPPALLPPKITSTQPNALPDNPYHPLFTSTSQMPPPSQAFGGLPGLFMSSTPVPTPSQFAVPPTAVIPRATGITTDTQSTFGSPAAPPVPFAVPRKRPVASDFDTDLAASVAPSALKRVTTFGQSPRTGEDERMIIEVSDNDDDDEEDDLDSTPVQSTPGFQMYGGYHNTLPKSSAPTPSAPGTPSAAVNNGLAEYEKKMEEINDFKRRIAEKEARARASAAKSGKNTPAKLDASSNGSSGKNTPLQMVPLVNGGAAPKFDLPTSVGSQPGPRYDGADTPLSAAAIARREEESALRRRLAAIQQRGEDTVVESAPIAPAREMPAALQAPALTAPAALLDNSVASPSGPVAEGGQTMDISSDEDGEVKDDDEDDTAAHLIAPIVDGRIGSQATTANASQSQAETEVARPVIAADDPAKQIGAAQDMDIDGSDSVSNTEDETSDEDEDAEILYPTAPSVSAVDRSAGQDEEQNADASSNASSDGDDYEPAIDQSNVSSAEGTAEKSLAVAAAPAVNAATDVALAPELQRPAPQPAADDQVGCDADDWGDIY